MKYKVNASFDFGYKRPVLVAAVCNAKEFAIMTTNSTGVVSSVHHRMPLLLEDRRSADAWIANVFQTQMLHVASEM